MFDQHYALNTLFPDKKDLCLKMATKLTHPRLPQLRLCSRSRQDLVPAMGIRRVPEQDHQGVCGEAEEHHKTHHVLSGHQGDLRQQPVSMC